MSVKEKLRMSVKEADRLRAMRRLDKKCLTIAKASEQFIVDPKVKTKNCMLLVSLYVFCLSRFYQHLLPWLISA